MKNFKDELGRYRTLSLFCEFDSKGYEQYFTLSNEDREIDGKIYISVYKKYMEYFHVPGQEYDFANEVLGGWKHWCRLCANAQLYKEIALWREEMDIKLRSTAIKSLINTSFENNAAGANAAKWLAEKGYELKRGRPSKAEREGYLKQEEKLKDVVDEDLERVGLTLVK